MRSIVWTNGAVRFIDQTRLPLEETYITTTDVDCIADAIRSLRIRGAPLIGIAAAYGLALVAFRADKSNEHAFRSTLRTKIEELKLTRPTAVNLRWALERMERVLDREANAHAVSDELLSEAKRIHEEDEDSCRTIALNGAPLIPDGASIITHCNTGFLATGGDGTALAVLAEAYRSGKKIHIYVDETRPLLQGARLTMWELRRLGIPCTLMTDSMAASVMATGEIKAIIVGADRIACNGDTANKVGTYSLAVNARHHRIPFYVAAPTSSIDPLCDTGTSIVIERRDEKEVTEIQGVRIAPTGIRAHSPAFDITPYELITRIITEKEVFTPPYDFSRTA